jgi:rhomboid protease GluP
MVAMPQLDYRRSPVTVALLAVMVALEIFFNLQPDARWEWYNQWLGIWWQIWTGQIWRPLTSCLMHGDLIHLAFNCFWLAVFGPVLEERFGSWRTLGLIIVLGYVSSLSEYIIDGYVMEKVSGGVGFSGIGYGLFGFILIGRRYVVGWWAVCDDPTVKLFVGWFFFCILLTWTGALAVGNIAHGAGFLFGALYGLAIFDQAHRRRWLALSVALTLLVLSTMVVCPGHPHYEYAREQLASQRL